MTYFLGANSAYGFHSYYGELFSDPRIRQLIVLKGGAGCGKSTLMRAVAREGAALGLRGEELLCSSDPDSLDGLILPEAGLALVDGTAPHVVEPPLCGCGASYLDLGRHYNPRVLQARRRELEALKAQNAACYPAATACFQAADALTGALPPNLGQQPLCSLRLPREPLGDRPGRTLRRFYHGLTPQGPLALPLDRKQVWVLHSNLGLAGPLLRRTAEAFRAAGYDVILGESPFHPGEVTHLEIPTLDLGYALDCAIFPYPGEAEDRCDLDGPAREVLSRSDRETLDRVLGLSRQLTAEGLSHLRRAKELHDALEALYRDGVDFAGVNRDTETVKQLLRELAADREKN